MIPQFDLAVIKSAVTKRIKSQLTQQRPRPVPFLSTRIQTQQKEQKEDELDRTEREYIFTPDIYISSGSAGNKKWKALKKQWYQILNNIQTNLRDDLGLEENDYPVWEGKITRESGYLQEPDDDNRLFTGAFTLIANVPLLEFTNYDAWESRQNCFPPDGIFVLDGDLVSDDMAMNSWHTLCMNLDETDDDS